MHEIFGISTGLPHTVGELLGGFGESVLGSIGLTNTAGNNILPVTTGGSGGTGGGGGFTTIPGTGGPMSGGTPGCASYKIVTTVHSDGTTTSKRVRITRRRKRRLATRSDIADLAALKSVLGGGKALDSWIATRGR